MAIPILGLFSDCPPVAVHAVVTVLVADLMQEGLRVVLVDADPSAAPYARLVTDQPGAPRRGRASLLGNLHNPDAEPLRVDLTASERAFDPKLTGTLWVQPALVDGEVADPALLATPPLQGARRYLSLHHTLGTADADVVLLVAPIGRTELGTALLAHTCDAAVLMADSTAAQVLHLANMARNADARRGGLIPTLCVEARDRGTPVPEGAWTMLWRTHPSLLPPHRKGEEGPERLLVLGQSLEAGQALLREVLVLLDDCTRDAPQPDGSAFAALYKEDRAKAVAFFRAQIAPRLGTRDSAVASLRAVWALPDRSWEDVQVLAKFAVQKFRREDPTPDAEALLPLYEALAEAAAAGQLKGLDARVRIDLAAMLLHVGYHRQTQDLPFGDIAARAEALVLEAAALERTPGESGRLAEVLALHARLTGAGRHYGLALQELRHFGSTVAWVVLTRVTADVVGAFAYAEPGLWRNLQALSDALLPLDERYGLWWGAIAAMHLGDRREALALLHRLGVVDPEAFFIAYQDPDFRPLWEGGGHPIPYVPPRKKKR